MDIGSMDRLFSEALPVMERAFRHLEEQVPSPVKKPMKDGFWYRYEEQNIRQAVLQKCAQVVSNIAAAHVLLKNGFTYEKVMMYRSVDETYAEVLFLVGSEAKGAREPRHDKYLQEFWAETFADLDNVHGSRKALGRVSRREINAYIARELGSKNPYLDTKRREAFTAINSGFVHGSSPAIMDLCVGTPPRFKLRGNDTPPLGDPAPRLDSYFEEAWQYFNLALMTLVAAALVFRDQSAHDQTLSYLHRFATIGSRIVANDPDPWAQSEGA
jgi:hypothetical protein